MSCICIYHPVSFKFYIGVVVILRSGLAPLSLHHATSTPLSTGASLLLVRHRHLVAVEGVEPSLVLSVLLRQLLARNEEANGQAQPREGDVEDEHDPQGVPVRILRDGPLGLGQLLHLGDARLRVVARQQAGDVVAQFASQRVLLVRHARREDDAAHDDGDGRRQLPDEHEGAGCAGNVARLNGRLQRDQGRLEVGADAHAEDDLETHNLGPVGRRAQVDEESVAQRHEREAPDDGRHVLARLLDEEARHGRRRAQDKREGEDVDARHEGVGAEDALEVERQVVAGRDEDEAVARVEAEDGQVARRLEEAHGHDGELGQSQLDKEEDGDDHEAEDDQADELGRVPAVRGPAQLEPEEEHQGPRDDGQRAEPVDGGQALLQGRPWVVQFHRVPQHEESNTRNGEVDVEAPPPAGFCREDTAEHFCQRTDKG